MVVTDTDNAFHPRTKLPLWQTLRKAYGAFFENLLDVLRVTWLWLILLGATAYFVSRAQSEFMSDFLQTPLDHAKPILPPLPLKLQTLGLLQLLLFAVGGSSIAVAWHRFLLLRESPGVSGSNVADRPVWHYLLAGIIIFASGALVSLPFLAPDFFVLRSLATAATHGPPPIPALPALLLFIAIVLFFMVTIRLSLLLPARAVGDDSLTIREAWQRTKGSTWRIFWGVILSSVPPVALMQLVFIQSELLPFLPRPGETPAEHIKTFLEHAPLASAIGTMYFLCVGLVTIGFLSFAYRHLIEPIRR